jgi:hypothetical protein
MALNDDKLAHKDLKTRIQLINSKSKDTDAKEKGLKKSSGTVSNLKAKNRRPNQN